MCYCSKYLQQSVGLDLKATLQMYRSKRCTLIIHQVKKSGYVCQVSWLTFPSTYTVRWGRRKIQLFTGKLNSRWRWKIMCWISNKAFCFTANNYKLFTFSIFQLIYAFSEWKYNLHIDHEGKILQPLEENVLHITNLLQAHVKYHILLGKC